jgi:hypothetical protein
MRGGRLVDAIATTSPFVDMKMGEERKKPNLDRRHEAIMRGRHEGRVCAGRREIGKERAVRLSHFMNTHIPTCLMSMSNYNCNCS